MLKAKTASHNSQVTMSYIDITLILPLILSTHIISYHALQTHIPTVEKLKIMCEGNDFCKARLTLEYGAA
jgi:hypothetical protein